MVPRAQELPRSLVQMELVFLLKKEAILKRFAEHFVGVNWPSSINDTAIKRQQESNV